MTTPFAEIAGGLEWSSPDERLRIEPWGPHSLRVRATPLADFPAPCQPESLLAPQPSEAAITLAGEEAVLVNGRITATLSPRGRVVFTKTESGEVLLAETPVRELYPSPRHFSIRLGDLYRAEARFEAQEGERFYGLGQHKHGRLDQKGCVLELQQRNSEVNIPFLLSNRGYGFLWNNPGVGRVELAENRTRWVADATEGVDYWITAGDAWADITRSYADATGRAPALPHWATGFIQCKLRYKTQDELMEVAREYRKRGLPLDCIVIDFFHWPHMGDMDFDEACWPDPDAMIAELKEMGVELMISIWPAFNVNSVHFDEMRDSGFLLRTKRGLDTIFQFIDMDVEGKVSFCHYDPTHPGARARFWELVKEGYVDRGIRTLWLDCCEPQMNGEDTVEHLRFHAGDGLAVANIYPLAHQQGVFEGLVATGESEIFSLCRSAFAGSQRYGAAVWSGDILSTFPILEGQVKAGLNMCMSGIPWWTTDIGGFMHGDPETNEFRELIVRWFQYGVFCPLFRLHGVREPVIDHKKGGQPNEVWSFGEEAYAVIRELLFLRERLRPYVTSVMEEASEGVPPMRPVFFDYPDDPAAADVEDQFLFGPDILVCPVTRRGATEREVVLPAGATWIDTASGETLDGGQRFTAAAPIERIPVYLREGGRVPLDLYRGEAG